MKSLFCLTFLMAATLTVPAQKTPPAPVPDGASGTAGSALPSSTPAATAEPSAPVDPAVPEELKQYGLDRYDRIVEKSPFNFTIRKPLDAPTISFAADLSLAGFTIDAGKGITYASLVDKKKKTRFVINDQAPNKDGIQLVQLNRGPTLLASTVLVRKGGEHCEIKADAQIVKRKAAPVVPGGRQETGPVRNGPPAPGGPDQQPPQPGRRVTLPPPVPAQ